MNTEAIKKRQTELVEERQKKVSAEIESIEKKIEAYALEKVQYNTSEIWIDVDTGYCGLYDETIMYFKEIGFTIQARYTSLNVVGFLKI